MGFWDGSGISWTICKQSAPHSRQITIPTPHHSIFTGRMLILTPNQQCLAAVRTNAVSEKQTQQLPSTDACLQSAALYSVHELARVRRSFWHGETGRWCRTGVGAAAGTVGLSPASGGCHASCLVGHIRDGILRKREAANWQFAVCSFHCTRDMTRHLSTQLRSGERGLVVGFCSQPHYCYRPYYPTARFPSPSSYMVSDEPLPDRSTPMLC